MKVLRIFLSSTFRDFSWERGIVNLQLVPQLNREFAAEGVVLDLLDLRWGVTEASGRDQATTTICLDEVRRCCGDGAQPAFILLLGQRTGWRPLPRLISQADFEAVFATVAARDAESAQLLARWYEADANFIVPTLKLRTRWADAERSEVWRQIESTLHRAVLAVGPQLSTRILSLFDTPITEQELDAALKFRMSHAGCIAVLRRELDTDARLMPELCDSDVLDRDRIERMWDRVISSRCRFANRMHCIFDDQHRPDAAYQEQFRSWFCDVMRAAARDSIPPNISPNSPTVPVEWSLAPGQVDNSHLMPVVPRRIEPSILSWARGTHTPPESAIRLLFGSSGSGKSAVVQRLTRTLSAAANDSLTVRALMLGMPPEHLDAQTLIDRLRAVMQDSSASNTSLPQNDEPHYVRAASILFVDAIESVLWRDPSEALSWLPEGNDAAASTLRVMLTTSDTALRDAFVDFFGASAVWTLGEMTDDETEVMMSSDLARSGRRLQPTQLARFVTATRGANGRALLTRIGTRIALSIPANATPTLPEPSIENWLSAWRTHLAVVMRYGEPLVDAVLALICVARSSLPERLLFELVGQDEAALEWIGQSFRGEKVQTVPRALFARLLADIGDLLIQEVRGGQIVMRFAHRLIAEHLHAVLAPDLLVCARRRLANAALIVLDAPVVHETWAYDEALYQLTACGLERRADVERLAARPEFIAEKCTAVRVADTLIDTSLLAHADYLCSPLLEEFTELIRRRYAAIAKLPDADERIAMVKQALRELLPSNALRRAAYPDDAQHAPGGLVARLNALDVTGLTRLSISASATSNGVLAGDELVFAQPDGTLSVLDTEFGRERRRLPGHAGGISDIVVLPHGRLLTCGQDGEVAYSSVRAGRDIMRLRTAGTALQMARQTPSGNFVATSHSTAEIFRWEARGQLSGCVQLDDDGAAPSKAQLRPDIFMPNAPQIANWFPSTGADLVVIDDDTVLTIGMFGAALFSFRTGTPLLLISQLFQQDHSPLYAVPCRNRAPGHVLIATSGGGIFDLDIEQCSVQVLSPGGISPRDATRGRAGGVRPISSDRLLVWALRSETEVEVIVLDCQHGTMSKRASLEVPDIGGTQFFRGALSNVPRGLIERDDQTLFAWSGYGCETIDLALGKIVALAQWDMSHYVVSAAAIDTRLVVLQEGGRAIVSDMQTGEPVANFSRSMGEIETMRAIGPGKLLVQDRAANVAFWNVNASLKAYCDEAYWLELCHQPTGVRDARLLDARTLLVQTEIADDSAKEFEFWQIDAQGVTLVQRTTSRNTTAGGGFFRESKQSGLDVIESLAVSWGNDSKLHFSDARGETVAVLALDEREEIRGCVPCDLSTFARGDIPSWLAWTASGLFLCDPQHGIATPLKWPGHEAGDTISRAWNSPFGIWLVSARALWFLPDPIPECTSVVHVLALSGLVRECIEFGDDAHIAPATADALMLCLPIRWQVEELDRFGAKQQNTLHALMTLVLSSDCQMQAVACWFGARFLMASEPGVVLEGIDHDAFRVTVSRAPNGNLESGFVVGSPDCASVYARHAGYPRQIVKPLAAVTLRHEVLGVDSSWLLQEQRIVLQQQRVRSIWYCPEGYQLLDTTFGGRRLLIRRSNGTLQILDTPEAGDPENITRDQIRTARWLREIGHPAEALEQLNSLLATDLAQELRPSALLESAEAGMLTAGGQELAHRHLAALAKEYQDSPETFVKMHGSFFVDMVDRAMVKWRLLCVTNPRELVDFVGSFNTHSRGDRQQFECDLLQAGIDLVRPEDRSRDLLNALVSALRQQLAVSSDVPHRILALFDRFVFLLKATEPKVVAHDSAQTDWGGLLSKEHLKELSRAQAGDGVACSNIGVYFGSGQGACRNLQFALYWYERAATAGNAGGAYNASQMLRTADGVPEDPKRSFEFMKLAADRGMPIAQCNLGGMYLDGYGCKRDYAPARMWFEAALAAGDELAGLSLAMMYVYGLGVLVNAARAQELLRPWISRNDPRAAQLLEVLKSRKLQTDA